MNAEEKTQVGKDGIVEKKTGVARLLNAFYNSWKGLKAAWTEEAFKQEVWLLSLLTGLAIYLPLTLNGIAFIIASHIIILMIEVLNSAIEATVDRIGLEFHPLSGMAKDLGSLAVFLSFMLALLAWIVAIVN